MLFSRSESEAADDNRAFAQGQGSLRGGGVQGLAPGRPSQLFHPPGRADPATSANHRHGR